MGFQTVQGKFMYVVELTTMPELPITGVGAEAPFAEALTQAIVKGLVQAPGTYGIEVYINFPNLLFAQWNIYHITNPEELNP